MEVVIYQDRHALMPIYPQGPRHMERLGQPTQAAESAHILGPVPSCLCTCSWLGKKPRWVLHVGSQWSFAVNFCQSNSHFCSTSSSFIFSCQTKFCLTLPHKSTFMSYNMNILQTLSFSFYVVTWEIKLVGV